MHGFHNNFVINVDIELWSRIPCWRRPITSEWRVFECVDAKKGHDCQKTSDWPNSDCSAHGKYRQRNITVTVNFFINVDIEPWSRLPYRRHHITSDWRVFECVDAKEAT